VFSAINEDLGEYVTVSKFADIAKEMAKKTFICNTFIASIRGLQQEAVGGLLVEETCNAAWKRKRLYCAGLSEKMDNEGTSF